MTNIVQKPEIDIGLAALCKHAKPDQTLTRKDIADVCGCSRRLILMIERKAIRKLQNKRRLKRMWLEHQVLT